MKRYYITKIIGDGTWENPIRAKISGIPEIGVATEMALDPVTGSPLVPWALCLVTGNKHGQLMSDPDNTALPDLPLDVKLSAMQTATKAKLKGDLAARGIPTALVDSADGYRDTIRGLGKLLNPNFDENNFDISE